MKRIMKIEVYETEDRGYLAVAQTGDIFDLDFETFSTKAKTLKEVFRILGEKRK